MMWQGVDHRSRTAARLQEVKKEVPAAIGVAVVPTRLDVVVMCPARASR